MSGYVLQCRPAVATQSGIWTDEAIQTMSEVAPKTVGNPWDGKAETWNGYFERRAVEEGRAYRSADGTEYW